MNGTSSCCTGRTGCRSEYCPQTHSITAVKLLLVSFYFPPAGGGGVQRPLKLATHLPATGIETHVLAPDDPKWIHPAEELHGLEGLDRLVRQAGLLSRRFLVPDENVTWTLTAVPAAIRLIREH